MMKKKRIDSIQGLRAICFMQIFFAHTCYFNDNVKMSWLTVVPWALEFFMLISGFGMGIGYKDKVEDYSVSFRNMIKFTLEKIKKVYPLHLFVLAIAVLYEVLQVVLNGNTLNIKESLVAFAAQVTLLQSWLLSAKLRGMFNGITWFLSSLLFCYFLTIPLLKLVKKIRCNKILLMGGVIIFKLLVCMLQVEEYWIHIWPVSKAVDYTIGIVAAMAYCEFINGKNISKIKASIFQIMAMIILIGGILGCTLYYNGVCRFVHPDGILSLLCILFILSITMDNGIISVLLSSKAIVWVGNISMELYLLHYMTIKYVWSLLGFFGKKLDFISVLIELLLSFLFSIVWIKLYGLFTK